MLIVSILLSLAFVYTCKRLLAKKRRSPLAKTDAIVLTGCDSGIGLAIAKHFLNNFDFKIICCFYDYGHSKGFNELKHYNDRVIKHKLDLKSGKDIEELGKLIDHSIRTGAIGKLAALINNAGCLVYGEFDWLTWDQVELMLDANLKGTIRLTKELLPRIIESRGRIINVSSVSDSFLLPGLAVYAASKAGLSAFTDGLGLEMSRFGLSVIKIRLGDFAKCTSIMNAHAANSKVMWDQMSQAKKAFYSKGYFDQYHQLATTNSGSTGPSDFADSTLYLDFEDALLSENPDTLITIAPFHMKIIYLIVNLLVPTKFKYYILNKTLDYALRLSARRGSSFAVSELNDVQDHSSLSSTTS